MAKILAVLGFLGLAACGSNPNTTCFQQSCVPSSDCNCVALAACSTANAGTATCGVGMVCCPPVVDAGQ